MDFRHQSGAREALQMFGVCSLILVGFGNCDTADSSLTKCQVRSCHMRPPFVGNSIQNVIGCLPCSQKFLAGSYINSHNKLHDSDFLDLLAQETGSNDLCERQLSNISMLGLSDILRRLIGEGSHRHLVSSIEFNILSDVTSWLDNHICEVVLIERLPIGVFADQFELQHLVHRGVLLDAAVFGDANLELPSALSNRSVVEIHIDIGHFIPSKRWEADIQLPLHARYPPLDVSGYSRVTIYGPELFLRCRPRNMLCEACLWGLTNLGSASANMVMWRIPCGNEAHAGLVSGFTFASALVCSILIVISAISFSGRGDIKDL